jgi:hypothetical protein
MTILELVKQLDTLKRDYKRQIEDLPKSYVRGTDVFREAVARTKANYETSKEGILEQINKELVKIEAKAETEQKMYDSLTKPTLEDVAEGYKVIDVITKTAHVLSPATLENLLLKVKDVDQLAVINDVIAATGELDLKLVVKKRIMALDSFDAERRDTMQLVEDFKQALAVSGDSMTFTVMNLASQLSETKEV